ncbi:hypothetical protein JCM3774_005449 [Rhodotorula dairenensis]
MPVPRLPIELVRETLEVLLIELEDADEAATKLLAYATVSKAWKAVVEELAFRRVVVDLGGFDLVRNELAAANGAAEKCGTVDTSFYKYEPDDKAATDEYLATCQRHADALIASQAFPRHVETLEIRLHMRYEQQLCDPVLATLAALCARFQTDRAAEPAQSSDQVHERRLECLLVCIYQEEYVMREKSFRRVIHDLATLGPLRSFVFELENDGQVIMENDAVEGSAEGAAHPRPAPTLLAATEVNYSYCFLDIIGSAEACSILLVDLLQPDALKRLTIDSTAHLPPPSWWRECKNLEKLRLVFDKHVHVRSTASVLLNSLPEIGNLRHLHLGCSELDEDMLASAALFARHVPRLHRFPSPYALSAILGKLPASVVSVSLYHTHFEMPSDLPAVPISAKLKVALRTEPHARVASRTLKGNVFPLSRPVLFC